MRFLKIASFISLIILCSCKAGVDLQIESIGNIVVTYNGTGELTLENPIPNRQITFESGADEVKKLKAWFLSNDKGWNRSYVTPAAGEIMVSGDRFHLNILGDFVVLSYQDSEDRIRVFTKSINGYEFDYLKNHNNRAQ